MQYIVGGLQRPCLSQDVIPPGGGVCLKVILRLEAINMLRRIRGVAHLLSCISVEEGGFDA
jgi:hypothetical protein